jgi:hypothetical protein
MRSIESGGASLNTPKTTLLREMRSIKSAMFKEKIYYKDVKMPYRGRAVKRIKGQRAFKPLNPTVKFTLTKTYRLSKGAAVGKAYVLEAVASSPFNPLSAKNGDWAEVGTNTEPTGLDSDMYSHYRHLIVKGCHITASVVGDVDKEAAVDENSKAGQLTIVRTTATNLIDPTGSAVGLKELYGQKTRNFMLGSDLADSSQSLIKSAYCSNGYSAKKTWNVNANANDDLRVVNQAGSSNRATDNTFLSVVVIPRVDQANFLKPTIVTIRLSYIVQFQEPTVTQITPMPMQIGGKKYKKKSYKSSYIIPATAGGLVGTRAGQAAYAMNQMFNQIFRQQRMYNARGRRY